MSVAAPRVVIASGREPTRIGLRVVLEEAGCRVEASAVDAAAAIGATLARRPQVCLLDAILPGGGMEAMRAIKAEAPEVRVVLFVGAEDDELVLAWLRAGADGVLDAHMETIRLAATVRCVAEGEAVLPRSRVGALIDAYRSEGGHGTDSLQTRITEREREVLDLLLCNASTSEVAYELGVNAVTVRRHIASIVHKSGMSDRASAVDSARAQRFGLGEPDEPPERRQG